MHCTELASRKRKGDDKPVEKLPVQALGMPTSTRTRFRKTRTEGYPSNKGVIILLSSE